MRITLRALRLLIKENYYDLGGASVMTKWPDEYEAAVKYVAGECGVKDPDAAEGYLKKYWTWDTGEHEGKPFLMARDENTRVSMAFHPLKKTWYKRVSMADPVDCERVGEEIDSAEMKKATSAKPSTGTMVTGGPKGDDTTKTRVY